MQGAVIAYQRETNTGLISGHDGVRYSFTRADWTSPKIEPREGLRVDFETNEKSACQIIVLKHASRDEGKSRSTAIILALLLGGIGIHKFYLGQVGLGVVYLLFCWTFIPAIIAFIEMIVYICMSDNEFHRRYST